ncbi:RNA-dependent RNA polymerase, mitoviral [Sesbania bispinosa]|nr:RNA-dependent RNA polymerase, mitoviral [Sesbania bispinosa]
MSYVQKFSEVRDWLQGLIRKLANRYLSQALSRPLYQGISWEPTWKALPTDHKRPGQSRRERGIFANFTSEFSHSIESCAGKRRVFAIGNHVNQRVLRPLNNWLMEALGDLKTGGTFNQSAPLDRLVGEKKIYSIDLNHK